MANLLIEVDDGGASPWENALGGDAVSTVAIGSNSGSTQCDAIIAYIRSYDGITEGIP